MDGLKHLEYDAAIVLATVFVLNLSIIRASFRARGYEHNEQSEQAASTSSIDWKQLLCNAESILPSQF